MVAENAITLAVRESIATVTIDSPPVNAFTMANYLRLAEIFEEINGRADIQCVVLTASGTKAFCAGLDLHEFLAADVDDDDKRQEIGLRTFAALRACPVPVIAAVNGPALGAGCVFTALCDIRIASEKATFGLPEINVGRCGGAAHLGRLIPQGMVRLMFFTGEPISAHEALRVGLVEQVVPPRRLLSAAYDLAQVISRKSPLGLRIGKKALNAVEFVPFDQGYSIEQGFSTDLVHTEDSREALRAVVERRAPVFIGR
ncbi:MAG: enoyl-CoA hydratase [Hyphomicrobiales bacterium]|nr:MAG: enoyl-CoA hydratase [Hyphomicrobiales bacterium]